MPTPTQPRRTESTKTAQAVTCRPSPEVNGWAGRLLTRIDSMMPVAASNVMTTTGSANGGKGAALNFIVSFPGCSGGGTPSGYIGPSHGVTVYPPSVTAGY